MSREALQHVLSCYPGRFEPRAKALGNAGGFSGAKFWRVTSGEEVSCLRCWPREHPAPERLLQIHRVLRHVADSGLDVVPAPFLTRSGESFVSLAGHLWELSPWLPGQANYAIQPTERKLSAALHALARFHIAAASFEGVSDRPTPSRGVSERHERLRMLRGGGIARIERALHAVTRVHASSLERRIVELFHRNAGWLERRIAAESARRVRQQPCIRDIWHDHILFVGEQVTGIVDFGALRTETVAGDIARLLGSLAKDDPDQWRTGIAAYESIRPLEEEELPLISAFDQTTVLMSAVNWLEWIYVDGRKFDDFDRIQQRLTEGLARLEFLSYRQRE